MRAIQAAPLNEDPFDHVALNSVFQEETYRNMVDHLPPTERYVALRHKDAKLPDGSYARVEFQLTDRNLQSLNGLGRRVWTAVAEAMRHPDVERVLTVKFAAAIAGRSINPTPRTSLRMSLLRDLPGFFLRPHQDIPRKLITAQFYLPVHGSHRDLGTSLHRRADTCDGGGLERVKTVPFLPNTGYAFTATAASWHSVDPIPAGVNARDSLMLIWYLDGAWLSFRASSEQAARSLRSRWRRMSAGAMQKRRVGGSCASVGAPQ